LALLIETLVNEYMFIYFQLNCISMHFNICNSPLLLTFIIKQLPMLAILYK
jgi:hypothetical protein